MSNELIAILSLGVTTLGVVAACAALMLTQTRNLRADLTKLIEDQGTVLGKRIEDQGTVLGKLIEGQGTVLGKRIEGQGTVLGKLIEGQGTVLGKRIEDQGTALNKRLDGQTIEIAEIKKEVYGLGKRMAHLEGLVEGLKEAVVARFAA